MCDSSAHFASNSTAVPRSLSYVPVSSWRSRLQNYRNAFSMLLVSIEVAVCYRFCRLVLNQVCRPDPHAQRATDVNYPMSEGATTTGWNLAAKGFDSSS